MEIPELFRDLLSDPAPIERAAGGVALCLAGWRDEGLLVMEEVLLTPLPEDPEEPGDYLPQCTTAHGAILEFAVAEGWHELREASLTLWEELRDGDRLWNPAVAARCLELLTRSGDEEALKALEMLSVLPVRVHLPQAPTAPRGWLARFLGTDKSGSRNSLSDEDLTPLPAEEAGDARHRAAAAFCASRALWRLAEGRDCPLVEQRLARLPTDLIPHLRKEDEQGMGALWFMAAAACYEGIHASGPAFVRVAEAGGPVLGSAARAAAAVLGDPVQANHCIQILGQDGGSVRGEGPAARIAVAQMLTLAPPSPLRDAADSFLRRCTALAEEDGSPDDPRWVLAADARDLLRYHRPLTGDRVQDAIRKVREGRPTDFVRWRY